MGGWLGCKYGLPSLLEKGLSIVFNQPTLMKPGDDLLAFET